jgi:hypothetical protein
MQLLTFTRRAAFILLLPLALLFSLSATTQAQSAKPAPPQAADAMHMPLGSPWLFAGFKRDSKDGVYYAISLDGYHWKLANGGKPVVPPTDPAELMRDPFLQRAPD